MRHDDRSPSELILARLRDLVERHSTSAAISRQLQWPENALARLFNRELRFDLGRVEQVLTVLNLPLRWFLDYCLDNQESGEPQHVLNSLCPHGDIDPFLERAQAHLPALLATLETRAEHPDHREMPDHLARIDQLRFTDRTAARARIEAQIENLLQTPQTSCASEIACALAVWAAIQRTRDRLGDASAALALAFEISGRFRLPTTTARLLQRASYVLYTCGEPRQALAFTERELVQFACQGCQDDVGRCLVDRGIVNRHLQNDRETIDSCREALRLLPASDWRNRTTAHQCIAEASLRLGRLDAAAESIDAALTLFADHRHDVCLGHAYWIKARILRRKNEDARAVTHYNRALDHLISGGGMSADIALVALDLARTYLRVGDLDQMRELACQIQAASPALRSSPIADRVLMEFVRVARYGNVTTVLLTDLHRKLTSATQQRAAD